MAVAAKGDDALPLVNQSDRSVLQLTGSIGFRVYVGDLLHLQSAFQCHSVVSVAANIEHRMTGVVFPCQLRQCGVHVQRLLDLLRDRLKLTDQPGVFLLREQPHGIGGIHGEQV